MRYQYLDILRWLCIFLMVLFHLNYSLVHIFGIETLNISQNFWYVVGRVSALWFMIISGVSYYLASKKYSAKQLQQKYLKYSWALAVIALAITLVTYLLIPEQLIVFGILHLFAVSFFLLPLVTSSKISSAISLIIIILAIFFLEKQVSNGYLFPLWMYNSDFRSADYYPLIPYFWYILGWYFIAQICDRYNMLRILHIKRNLYLPERVFSYIGKKSLIIYIIHQPIIVWIICVLI